MWKSLFILHSIMPRPSLHSAYHTGTKIICSSKIRTNPIPLPSPILPCASFWSKGKMNQTCGPNHTKHTLFFVAQILTPGKRSILCGWPEVCNVADVGGTENTCAIWDGTDATPKGFKTTRITTIDHYANLMLMLVSCQPFTHFPATWPPDEFPFIAVGQS